MENYVIRFQEQERDAVLEILSRSNDIIINHVEQNSVGITIQLDEADQAFSQLMDKIERELHTFEVVIVKVSS